MKGKNKLPNTFMLLGVLLLVFAFIAPFLVGDTFGTHLENTATPFASAAAFLLISANIMQQRELTLQREELTATKEVFMEQSKTMSRQRFENTFFSMLSLNNEIVSSVSIGNGDTFGRRGFLILYNQFRNLYNRPHSGLIEELEGMKTKKERVGLIYKTFFDNNENHLAHYFRNLYRIVKWISGSELTDEEKKEYIGILRAQLSTSELQLLFYNSLSDIGKKL